MSFKENILNKSNSYNYYKQNYESLKKLHDDDLITINQLTHEMNYDKMHLDFMSNELKVKRDEVKRLSFENTEVLSENNSFKNQMHIYDEDIKNLNNLSNSIFKNSFEYQNLEELGLITKLLSYKNVIDNLNKDIQEVHKNDLARITMKNFGSPYHSIEIIENSDANSKVFSPDWFITPKGEGVIVESFEGNLDLKIKVIKDGQLRLEFKNKNFKDETDILIDYTSLKINGVEYLKNHNLHGHDTPFIFEKHVKDREIFDIHLEWVTYDRINTYDDKQKENYYSKIRNDLINLDVQLNTLKNMPMELYTFYINVLNYENLAGYVNFISNLKKDYNFINKKEIQENIDEFDKRGLNSQKRKTPIIVSLTSFPDRMDDIHFCLYSLLTQNFKPDKIILWLAEEQFPNRENDLPSSVFNLIDNGLTIEWCKDIRSYKKLIPALKKYPDCFIVTVDDDIFYPEDWLEKMWKSYLKNPNTIISSRSRRVSKSKTNNLLNYSKWKLSNQYRNSSFLNFPTGAGGTLYFPNALYDEVFDEELFTKLCPTGDDIWFWAMAVLNDTKITSIDDPYYILTYINIAREVGVIDSFTLWDLNKHGNNDMQIQNVLNNFPEIIDKLDDD